MHASQQQQQQQQQQETFWVYLDSTKSLIPLKDVLTIRKSHKAVKQQQQQQQQQQSEPSVDVINHPIAVDHHVNNVGGGGGGGDKPILIIKMDSKNGRCDILRDRIQYYVRKYANYTWCLSGLFFHIESTTEYDFSFDEANYVKNLLTLTPSSTIHLNNGDAAHISKVSFKNMVLKKELNDFQLKTVLHFPSKPFKLENVSKLIWPTFGLKHYYMVLDDRINTIESTTDSLLVNNIVDQHVSQEDVMSTLVHLKNTDDIVTYWRLPKHVLIKSPTHTRIWVWLLLIIQCYLMIFDWFRAWVTYTWINPFLMRFTDWFATNGGGKLLEYHIGILIVGRIMDKSVMKSRRLMVRCGQHFDLLPSYSSYHQRRITATGYNVNYTTTAINNKITTLSSSMNEEYRDLKNIIYNSKSNFTTFTLLLLFIGCMYLPFVQLMGKLSVGLVGIEFIPQSWSVWSMYSYIFSIRGFITFPILTWILINHLKKIIRIVNIRDEVLTSQNTWFSIIGSLLFGPISVLLPIIYIFGKCIQLIDYIFISKGK